MVKIKKILYVEDNQDTAEAVKIMLEEEGYEVLLAYCGKEALENARKTKIDLFLLDIMLPDMSGWDVFKTLAESAEIKNDSKYIFLSVIPASTERMKELKKAGIADYITKPFTRRDLIERIKNIIG